MDQLDKANSMLSGVDDKRFPRVALLNAELSLRKGDPASALESLDYLRDDPDPEIMYLMARSYRDLGREAEAQNILNRLLKTSSEDEIARMFREEYLMRTSGGFENERDEAALWHLRKGAVFEENFYYRRAYNEFRRAKLLNKDNPDVWLAYTEIIRKLGYPEHYRDSLKAALSDIPESRTEYSMLEERLDLLEHSGKNSLAQRWEIEDPWNIPADEWDVGVYVREGCSSLPVHTGAEETLALYFADLMDILPDIRLPLDGTGRNPEVKTVSGYSQAFRESRESLDYFVLIGFTETSRTFSAVADLYLAGTGEKIGSFNQLRTGQSRVTDTLHMLAQSLSERVPRLLDIVSVNGNRVLLDKGRWQGIETEQTWVVLRKGSADPSAAEDGLVYSRENYLGTVEIDEVSEPLSEGTYTRSGDFDFISPGDELYLLPVPETADTGFSAPDPAFKASLLAIP
jgi:tetratricopeptide (TPR) repeat protein